MALASRARALLPGARSWGAVLARVTAQRAMSHRVVVETDAAAGVAVMKFRNPPVNSLSLEMVTELVINLEKLENDKTVRGLIFTSESPGVFSSGLNLLDMYGRNPAHYAEYWKAVQELWLRLYQCPMVTVATINGACPAGGCLISMTCDYRVMADNPKYTIGLNETQLGIVAPFWFKDTLVNTIGYRASEISLQLGLLYPPAEALRVGIVDKVVPEDQVHSAALAVMAQWLAIPDHARQLTKAMLRKPTVDNLVRQRDADIQQFVSFISRDSIQKGLQMYLQMLKQKKA
ncbi:enoyl-CoA delta isomerase 1, mitochondrial [Echinops telfairi]|uniref:Enoyl-CoA delta isomerase 1, mitochondrial n=1 Tax=Echinops telfairi TaxID=9371 RepID=A0ABM0IRP7_ECHTE|nr:enoyl-CoA delta isomerase 1, mitochondrial [Echinops telfairi]